MRRSKPRSPTARNHFERRGIGSTQTRIHHEFKSDFLQNLARLRIVESAECDARFVRCSFASLVENPLDWPDIFDRAANPKTRKNLARFLATLLMRHPAAREMVGEVNQRLRDLASGAADDARIAIRGRHGDAEISVADVREYVAISADEVRTDWLRQMPAVSRPLGDQLFARRWGLVFAETDSFITCDNPVSLDRGASRRAKF